MIVHGLNLKSNNSSFRNLSCNNLMFNINILFTFYCRFFSLNRADDRLIDNTDGDDVDIIIRPNTSPNIATVSHPSSNNLMNANLSGSFREDNDVDDDILDGRNQNGSTSPRNKRNSSTPNFAIAQPGTSASDLPTSSSYSASPNNGIGVPAIPNINFNPTRQTSRRNDFI